ncbi:PEP-CTERM sorting domain-containing protein [Novosphingobium sp. BW1]|uniref:PEP-CTERM sorting domain-containing protein n=1 Tax=Novosphingobium sp. BW1 TaxID=2592621 RepID=UPI0011DE778F|nr:PEP-CTERM sorting domain-containing protein [Novosphingobium sp. BW1]TYC85037.1 PEP-CTERM sorting domain-containing protein [Novosphingobium sp. BW1]
MLFQVLCVALVGALLGALPAHAADGMSLPEPSGLFLLGLGVAGVMLGRRFARRREQD